MHRMLARYAASQPPLSEVLQRIQRALQSQPTLSDLTNALAKFRTPNPELPTPK
jgi:hypothetical protein